MFSSQRDNTARWMMDAGHSDEYIEEKTGLTFNRLLFLRASAAVDSTREHRSRLPDTRETPQHSHGARWA